MRIIQIPNGQFIENCYVIVDERAPGGGECAIVDPGEEAGLILHKVAATGAKPVAIWLTHAHIDHVLGVPRVAAETGAPVWLHAADRPLYDAVPEQAAWFGLAAPALPAPDRTYAHGDTVRVGDGVVLGGDVLFAGSIGRTDLPGGDFDTLIASIERELLSLPEATIVYSGHGPETTVGHERRSNPFLTGAARLP